MLAILAGSILAGPILAGSILPGSILAGSILPGPILAAVIAGPVGPDDSCPSARQVTDALQIHVAAALVAPERSGVAPRADVLRTVLDVPPDGTVVRFSLVDARGDVQLRRALPAPGRGRPAADCVALADTIATIVERYLVSVPFQARETEPPLPEIPAPETIVASPPPEAPPPATEHGRAGRVHAGAAWRAASLGRSLFEVQLGGELDLTRGARRLATRLDIGVEEGQRVERTSGSASVSLRRVSARLGLSLALPAGPGAFEPAIEGGVDLFVAETAGSAGAATMSSLKTIPVGELKMGYRVTLGRYLFVRPQAGVGFAIVRYDVQYAAVGGADGVVFRTPGFFSTLGLAAGVVFR